MQARDSFIQCSDENVPVVSFNWRACKFNDEFSLGDSESAMALASDLQHDDVQIMIYLPNPNRRDVTA